MQEFLKVLEVDHLVEDVLHLVSLRIYYGTHILDDQIYYAIVVCSQSQMKWQLLLLIHVIQLLKQNWVHLLEALEDEIEFVEVLRHQSSFCKNSVLIQDVVIAFDVEKIVIPDVATFIEVVFDDKGHVAEGEIDEVSEDYPILRAIFYSMSFFELETHYVSIEVAHVEVIAFYLAATFTIDHVIIFCEEHVSLTILERQSVFLDIERVDLDVF